MLTFASHGDSRISRSSNLDTQVLLFVNVVAPYSLHHILLSLFGDFLKFGISSGFRMRYNDPVYNLWIQEDMLDSSFMTLNKLLNSLPHVLKWE